jgi:lipopolysaccharide/colanic/teichoic acid biosynthesis glycosyltransferase
LAGGPGPIIYRNRYVTAAGKNISKLKFRTISQEGREILIIGRWLRQSSLDQLPGLFDILMGNGRIKRDGSRLRLRDVFEIILFYIRR